MNDPAMNRKFFADAVRYDPFAHMVAHLSAQMWAHGYEQALRDNGLDEQRLVKSFAERMEDASQFITEAEDRVKALVAFWEAGKILKAVPR